MTTADLTTAPVIGSTYPARSEAQRTLSELIGGVKLDGFYDPGVTLGRGLFDRVSVSSAVTPPGTNVIDFGTMAGRPAVVVPDGSVVRRLMGDVAVNPNAWTVTAVVQIDGTASGVRDIIRPETAAPTGGPYLRVGISTSNRVQIMLNTSSTIRLAAPDPIPLGEPVVIVAAFSVDRGLTIRINGAEVARAEADVAPLVGQYGAGQYHWTRDRLGSTEMLFGCFAITNTDLTSPLEIGSLAKMEVGLATWYGLPPSFNIGSGGVSARPTVATFRNRAAFLAADIPASTVIASYLADDLGAIFLVMASPDEPFPAVDHPNGSKWLPASSIATLEHFGASEDAVNNGAAWQAAFNWMAQDAGRGIVEYSGRTYALQTGATTSGHFRVEGDFRLLATADISILSAVAPVQEIVALTANYAPGDLALSVAAMSAAIAPGRWIKLLSDAVNPLSRDAGPASGPSANRARCGRWIQVGAGSTTTSIALVKALDRVAGIDAYSGARVNAWTTAYAARVAVPQVRYGTIKGISWAYEDGHGDAPNQWSGQAVTVSGYMAPLFDRVSSDLGYGPAISLGGTVNAVVENCDFRNLKSNPALGQFGYGVHDTGYGTRVIGLTGERCRHVYTTGQSLSPENDTDPQKMWRQGDTVGSVVAFADVAGGAETEEIILAPLDTHHGAVDVIFDECRVSNAGSGLNNRGINTMVSGLTARGVGKAVLCFTERQDGDGYPLTAGKLVEDFASMTVDMLDAETTGTAVEVTTGTLTLRNGRIRSSSRGVFVSTGRMFLAGNMDVLVDALDGAAASVGNGDYNQPGILAPKSNLEPDRTLMGEPFIHILPGANLKVDARIAGPGGAANRLVSQITTTGAPDVYGRVINEGAAEIILPSTGLIWSQNAIVECRGDGVFRYDCDGASDTAGAVAGSNNVVSTKNARVISNDGSVYWDRALRRWPGERLVFSNGNVGITHNGASANTNLYTPPQDIAPYLAAGDSIRVELIFVKTGTGGTAVVSINTSGQSSNDAFTMPATDSYMCLTMTMNVTGSAAQNFLFNWQAGGATSRIEYVERTITQSAMAFAFRVGAPAMSGADTIQLKSCRIWCSAGGGKVS